MLKHRVGNVAVLKSETLPKFEGQDEEGEALLESAFDTMQITNSCPDLSIIVDDTTNNEPYQNQYNNGQIYVAEYSASNHLTVRTNNEDNIDGRYFNTTKIPLSFRRSTSLSSLEADGFVPNKIDANGTSGLQSNVVSKVVGKLEHALNRDYPQHQNVSEFTRSSQRSSYSGPPTGFLQKSISTPSVTQGAGSRQLTEEIHSRLKHIEHLSQNSHQLSHKQPATGSHSSSKRSFFRRKHKIKGGSLNSHPPIVQQYKQNPNGTNMDKSSSRVRSGSYDKIQESLGYSALIDPSLGLQDPDIECWTLFMHNSEVISRLSDKDIKRQEHMYEFILTEKHHCLILALMHHLFVSGMRNNGYRRQASLLFPGLHELLQVHISFFRKLREKQNKFKDLDKSLDSISDLLLEQFTAEPLNHMVRLYGLLCASHEKSLELFKNLKLKDQKFASLVSSWDKESLLGRKNVPECLLLVAQRITKYPLLIDSLLKASVSLHEREELTKLFLSSKDLNSRVNERVAERQRLLEICQKIDAKSPLYDGSRRIRREDLILAPTLRLLFHGQAIVNFNRVFSANNVAVHGGSAIPASNKPYHILILTDRLIITQELNGKLHFVSPPGVVKLNNMIVRENAGFMSSLFIVLGSGTNKPEMIELQVLNPTNREKWLEVIRDAKLKYESEAEICSDLEDELSSDALEFSDLKMSRVLDELHEHDKQILALLKNRTRVIESLRSEKPHHWRANSFDGKDDVLNAISVASEEIKRVMLTLEDTSTIGVNRSVSCASEHVSSSYGASGLPRRADTFGGFDSQQRSSVELSQCLHSKVLFQMVIQLADLCGEMFHQMVPNLTPNVYQANQQFQRRMEDLREAQQRLEAEKALWQQGFAKQKEEMAKQKNELNTLKEQLQNEQADISQQREQLYRKLEKLESKGIRPYLDSVSPVTINTNDKITNTSISSRRSPSQVSTSGGSANSSKQPPKQQLPLHLAAFSSVKSAAGNGNSAPEVKPRTVGMPSVPQSGNYVGEGGITRHNSGNYANRGMTSRVAPSLSHSQSVQQVLPLRLSEGNSSNNRSSTLPRGIGTQSVTNLSSYQNDQHQLPQYNNNNGNTPRYITNNVVGNNLLQHSKSSAGILTRNHTSNSPNYQPSSTSDRMNSYYANNTDNQSNNGHVEYSVMNFPNSAIPIVHKRSGSSPVPMSTSTYQNTYQQHQHQKGASDDDYDSSKILFL